MFELTLPGRLGDTAAQFVDRLDAVERNILDQLSVQQVRSVAILLGTAATTSGVAAAQSVSEVGSAMCGSGVGQLVGFGFIAGSLYFVLKGVAKAMTAMDKMGSTKQQSAREGKEAMAGSAKTFSAAFIPAVAAGVFEVLGISTVSCMSPSQWSVLMAGTTALPL
ncbi:hypothetical protein [Haloarcula nitratireducens]|uniref:Uncharacterized protein n=1 Tax=Haloarcula nitratireducens TaxID=2487749 RepID=A0AAW4PJA7_9EURY|nr:hypothetical protein [Halomicroarcula nitratireducens]MBX0298125.1 hypothetical protein [Halomicroarcula nitratireducens]